MRIRYVRRMAAIALIGVAGVASAVPAKAPPIAVFSIIEPGQWELHEVGSTAPSRQLCVTNPDMLIQLRHGGTQCARYVTENTAQAVTVNYDCDAAGSGRTTITLDTPRQIRVQTQGIAQAAPFDVEYSAHRVGACVGGH